MADKKSTSGNGGGDGKTVVFQHGAGSDYFTKMTAREYEGSGDNGGGLMLDIYHRRVHKREGFDADGNSLGNVDVPDHNNVSLPHWLLVEARKAIDDAIEIAKAKGYEVE